MDADEHLVGSDHRRVSTPTSAARWRIVTHRAPSATASVLAVPGSALEERFAPCPCLIALWPLTV